jgi:exodeoxyribonuclease V beta subunit
VLLEASAGTGKTFNLTSLVVRYVVEDFVPIESFLIVTFTKSAAAELRKKTRDKLIEALSYLEHGTQPEAKDRWLNPVLAVTSEDERQDRIEALRNAISGLDGAMITTIHGFCQRTLGQIGVRNGGLVLDKVGDGANTESAGVVRDTLLSLLARDINHFGEEVASNPEKIDKLIREAVDAIVANSASPHPTLDGSVGVAERWVSAVNSIRDKQETARRNSGETSFDDLILVLQRIISSKELGGQVREQLAAQYKVLMIDEFQDTDSKQWEIFNGLFSGNSGSRYAADGQVALIMVGDPKQAIYRFRGADINAYLRATANDDELGRYKLSTNHRSDRRLITATNALLDRRQFGHERISYVQVTSPPTAPEGALTGAGAPLQIRWLPSHEELLDGGKSLKVDIARPHIADDLANHVIQLLNSGQIHEKKGPRPVQESDITILVRAKDDAIPVVEALQRHGVPVIQSRLESVLNTEAAAQLSLLLTALDGYTDARTVRALAFGWFVNLPYQQLLDEQQVEILQTRCAMWADELSQHGVFSFYQRFRLDSQVVEAIASRAAQRGVESLERLQTDLEHVVELLHARTERLPLDARGYLLELAMLKSQPGDPEAQERRTESDLNAVNITTIHSSKGLEYPIVLLPYPKAVRNDKPYVYSIGPDRFVDAAPLIEWEAQGLTIDDRKELAREEADGDDMRLAYVALTRAKYQTVVWWANTRNMGASPLAKILFDESAAARSSVKVPKDSQVRAKLIELQSKAPGAIEVFELPAQIEVASRAKTTAAQTPVLSAATLTRGQLSRIDFWRWSYSSIKKSLSSSESEVILSGRDEPWKSIDVGETYSSPLQSQPSGAAYGTWIHEFMETVDFSQLDLATHLGATFDSIPVFEGADREAHILGLQLAIETPLDQIAPNFTLRKLARADRLDEATFLLEVGSRLSSVRLSQLAGVVASDPNHPFTEYFARMANSASGNTFQGLLTGSLDGLFRIPGAHGHSYLVVDYKTNKLRTYDFQSMRSEMELHDYPLQALIYSVGLHRMLKMRLKGYVPQLHLAGSAYLFLRGMVGPETPRTNFGRNGVFSWSYSPATIEAADRWFAGEAVS